LGVCKSDVVYAQVEGSGGVERIIRQGGCYFQKSVHFIDGTITQGNPDFLPQKVDAPSGADFVDKNILGVGNGVCGRSFRVAVHEKKFLLFGHVEEMKNGNATG
jgi:hypothetical protein